MKKPVNKNIAIHTIDAKGKPLGRLASEVANIIRGKHKVNFIYHQAIGDRVDVINAQKTFFSGRKLEQKKYIHHSGYPGGLKSESLKDLFKKDPCQVVKKAIYGMLPKNKLRKIWLKNLKIYSGEKENE